VISRSFSGKGVDQKSMLLPDDASLVADGACANRPFAADAIRLELTSPATLIGDHPFPLAGGQRAIWISAGESPLILPGFDCG
jgi:beta-galactosidase